VHYIPNFVYAALKMTPDIATRQRQIRKAYPKPAYAYLSTLVVIMPHSPPMLIILFAYPLDIAWHGKLGIRIYQ
jgi:hypothetical protein